MMMDTFSKFFVMDEDSPEYTACMALYIYEDLKRSKFIDAYAVDDKNCSRKVDVKIPNEYKHDTQNDDANEHCLVLSYKYTGYKGGICIYERWVYQACKLGICTGQSDLNFIQRKISSFTSSYWYEQSHSASRQIMRKSTASRNIV